MSKENPLKGEYQFKTLDKSSLITATVEKVLAYRVTLEYEDGTRPYVYFTDGDDLQDEIYENSWVKTKGEVEPEFSRKNQRWGVHRDAGEEVENSKHDSEPVPVLEKTPPSVDTGRTPESSPEPETSVQPKPVPTGEMPSPLTFRGRDLPYIPEFEQWVRHKVNPSYSHGRREWSVYHELRYVRSSSQRYGPLQNPWLTLSFWCGSFKHVDNKVLGKTDAADLDGFVNIEARPWQYEKDVVCRSCWSKKDNHSFEARENTKREVDRI